MAGLLVVMQLAPHCTTLISQTLIRDCMLPKFYWNLPKHYYGDKNCSNFTVTLKHTIFRIKLSLLWMASRSCNSRQYQFYKFNFGKNIMCLTSSSRLAMIIFGCKQGTILYFLAQSKWCKNIQGWLNQKLVQGNNCK